MHVGPRDALGPDLVRHREAVALGHVVDGPQPHDELTAGAEGSRQRLEHRLRGPQRRARIKPFASVDVELAGLLADLDIDAVEHVQELSDVLACSLGGAGDERGAHEFLRGPRRLECVQWHRLLDPPAPAGPALQLVKVVLGVDAEEVVFAGANARPQAVQLLVLIVPQPGVLERHIDGADAHPGFVVLVVHGLRQEHGAEVVEHDGAAGEVVPRGVGPEGGGVRREVADVIGKLRMGGGASEPEERREDGGRGEARLRDAGFNNGA